MKRSREENLWGIDLGGTKIEGIILRSAHEPEVIFRDRVMTGADQGYDHIVGQVKKLEGLMEAAVGYRPNRIGMASPGAHIPSLGVMKNCNTTVLNGKPFKKDLEQILGVHLEMANDANCFALAETRLGVVKERFPGAEVVFGVIMGTGVGGGLVVNGQVINGFHGIGGEWGHNYLPAEGGKPCYCGKTGCNESILSGPALENFYASLTGKPLPLKEIVKWAEEGTDPAARQTIDRLCEKFALAISVVVNILDPDVIVVGGGVGNIDSLYSKGVSLIGQHVFNHDFEAPVIKPSLGDSAGVFGAAYLVAEQLVPAGAMEVVSS